MRLITVGSGSDGNAYALDSGSEILLLEAGCKLSDVKKSIGYRLNDVVGVCISHIHGDHSKYAEEYAKNGIIVYCNSDVADNKTFPFGSCKVLDAGKTVNVGRFKVMPFECYHDVPNYGYLIKHEDMGMLLFASDTYKMQLVVRGVDHFLIEANYDDRILKANIEDGRIDRTQAQRLMLSHMSVDNTIHYLKECEACKSRTIILCHLSERNSNRDDFEKRIAGEFGCASYTARKGLEVELGRTII